MPELNEWDSFYVIVGSSAGALIGLQFVVMTLIAERPPRHAEDAGAAFASPTIVHFSVVLLLSAGLRAPWHSIAPIAMLWGLGSVLGVVYSLIVARRMARQDAYKPVLEDWCFHAVLPLASYVALACLALAAGAHERAVLFGVGSVALLLLFIGIRNSWDAVVYHALGSRPPTKRDKS